MELHTVHHHVFDATHEAGAVGLGQSTGHRQLLQTTWGDVDSNENEISEGGSRRWFLGQSYFSWELQTNTLLPDTELSYTNQSFNPSSMKRFMNPKPG